MKPVEKPPKEKTKWYIRLLTILVVIGVNVFRVQIEKIDPSGVLFLVVLAIVVGVGWAISASKQTTWADSPAFTYIRKILKKLNMTDIPTRQTGPAQPVPTINWIPALAFQAIALVLAVIFDIRKVSGEDEGFGGFSVVLLSTAAITIVLWSILHYRCWQALPARFRATTPDKAIGFMFIPFYDFYWAFISFVALPRGFVLHARNAGREPTSDPTPLGIAMAVLFICSFTIGLIPGIASLVGVASFVVWVLYYRQILPYANAVMADAGERVQGENARPPFTPPTRPTEPDPIEARRKPFRPEVTPTNFPPGAPPLPTPSIYIHKDGANLGPFTSPQVRAKVKSGAILESDLVWYEGCAEWVPVAEALNTPISGARPSSAPHADNNSTETPLADGKPSPQTMTPPPFRGVKGQ